MKKGIYDICEDKFNNDVELIKAGKIEEIKEPTDEELIFNEELTKKYMSDLIIEEVIEDKPKKKKESKKVEKVEKPKLDLNVKAGDLLNGIVDDYIYEVTTIPGIGYSPRILKRVGRERAHFKVTGETLKVNNKKYVRIITRNPRKSMWVLQYDYSKKIKYLEKVGE